MTDDELAVTLCAYLNCYDCPALSLCNQREEEGDGLKKWLKKDVEDGKQKNDENEYI